MKILFILFFTVELFFAQSSEKYFIFFKDKGGAKKTLLTKSSREYQEAVNSLSGRSIKRRKKTMGANFITYEDLPVNEEYVDSIKKTGAKIVWKLKWFNAVSAFLTKKELNKIKKFDFIERIKKVKKIKSPQPLKGTKIIGKTYSANKINYKYDYGASLTQYQLSDIPQVHNLGFAGKGVVLGILDAGFAWRSHVAIKELDVIAEHDFVYGDSNLDDGDARHGTAVFSLIAGFDEGNIIGPAFRAKFILAKTEKIETETHTEEDNYAAALQWMDSIGVDITTSSLGYNIFDSGEGDYTYSDMNGKTTIVTKAAELAFDRGILTITSAGNEGRNSWHYITAPADGINTLAVGAVNSKRVIASFSSRGPSYDGRIKPEVVAQGVNCFHAVAYSSSTSYGTGSGTSYSAPIVAGMAAQILSAFPYLSNKQMRSILLEGCDSTQTPNNTYGYGLLSVLNAIQFPNIEKNSSVYNLHKIIYDSLGINSEQVFFNYMVNSISEIHKEKMTSLTASHYIVSLLNKSITTGDTISFYFTYIDTKGTEKQIPANNSYQLIYNDVDVVLSTDFEPKFDIPKNFELMQNYPNPFNPTTTIEYSIPVKNKSNYVTLKIFDILGREVATLVNKRQKAGIYKVTFNAVNLTSGIYFYRLQTAEYVNVKKMILIK